MGKHASTATKSFPSPTFPFLVAASIPPFPLHFRLFLHKSCWSLQTPRRNHRTEPPWIVTSPTPPVLPVYAWPTLSLSLSLLFPSSRSILSEQRKSRFSTLPSNNFAKRNQINHDDEEDEEEETTDDATLQQEQKRPPAVCLPVIWPLLGIPHHENLCWNSLSSMWLAWVRRGVSKWVSE